MHRRRVLALAGAALPPALAGCLGGPPPGNEPPDSPSESPTVGGTSTGTPTSERTPTGTPAPGETPTGTSTPGETPTGTPTPDGGTPAGATRVTVVSSADQPDVPVEYAVEVAEPLATGEHPARLRVALSNPTESTVVLGEERAVRFHHVSSADEAPYLYPVGDGAAGGPVEPGCWRLTEPVAVPEYYGTLSLDPGETLRAASYVYGHPGLPDGECLPAGEHRVSTSGVAGESEDAVLGDDGATEFAWGFTLRIEE